MRRVATIDSSGERRPHEVCAAPSSAAQSTQPGTPLVSILLPVHNGMPYLAEAIESIRTQTYENLEIIILNDASTDETRSFLDRLSDERMRVFHCAKMGLPAILNRGLEVAHGKYIARMDSDDVAHPQRIECQVALMDACLDVAVCGCNCEVIDQAGSVIGEMNFPTSNVAIKFQLSIGSPISHPSSMIRTAALRHVGGYDEQRSVAQDYDLWWRLAEIGKLRNLPTPLLKYRVHSGSISTKHGDLQRAAMLRIATHHVYRNKLAESSAQSADYCSFIRQLVSQDRLEFPDSNQTSFLEVFERSLARLTKRDEGTHEEIAAIRQGLRWLCLGRSRMTRGTFQNRMRWFQLARAVDRKSMRIASVLTRATARAFQIKSVTKTALV